MLHKRYNTPYKRYIVVLSFASQAEFWAIQSRILSGGYNSTILELCLTDRPLWGWAVYIALAGNIPTEQFIAAVQRTQFWDMSM